MRPRIVLVVALLIVAATTAGCGGGTSAVDKANAEADAASCRYEYDYQVAQLAKYRVSFVSGYGLAPTIRKAKHLLAGPDGKIGRCLTVKQKRNLRHDMTLTRCDLGVAAEGRYCPGRIVG